MQDSSIGRDSYLRVTRVLSPFSGMDKIPAAVLDAACIRGSAVHELIEAKLLELPLPAKQVALYSGYLDSFDQWLAQEDRYFFPKVPRFYDDEHQITGECDGIFRNSKQELCLVDYKTSVKEGLTWALQGAAYTYMARKTSYQVDKILFVKLDKAGGPPEEFTYDYAENLELWFACLKVYKKFFY